MSNADSTSNNDDAPFQEAYADLQTHDDAELEDVFSGLVEQKREQEAVEADLQTEGRVRVGLKRAQEEIARQNDRVATGLLGAIRSVLHNDADLDRILQSPQAFVEHHPDLDDLSRAARIRTQWKSQEQTRRRGVTSPSLDEEYTTVSQVAKALGYFDSLRDMSRYAPVRFESIDEPGARTQSDPPTPVGRRRVGSDAEGDIEDYSVEIPHKSCDHVLAIALPRRGKDSTLASLGMNLKNEHQYSYFSVFDDGRMETPMLAVPSDDEDIQQSLAEMGQEPEAMDAEVFVPRMSGVPDQLPANFRPFTISIGDLTPQLILRLAGITKSDANAESRIKRALDETLEAGGDVSQLVTRLQIYAEETEATIQWTEIEERQSGNDVETYQATYEMRADKALEDAASQLARLAGEGLIASPSASTNIDMAEVIRSNEQAAVLCCNFMEPGQEALKYTIIDLWLRLIFQARDANPRLPRVALELRELKNLAPSKWADVRYKDALKPLRQTLFFLSTQGGSRRIMLLASTQKLTDVYKPIRSNMATKIMLQVGDEEIETLDDSMHFYPEQKEQLSTFEVGQGMIHAHGDQFWPIYLRGAPCGLGLGDHHWLDRYGTARGARVRHSQSEPWAQGGNPDWWVRVPPGQVVDANDETPQVREFYSDWYLLPSDFADEIGREDVSPEVVEQALATRRPYPVKADISLQTTAASGRQRTLNLSASGDTETADGIADAYQLPQAVHDWLGMSQNKRNRLVESCVVLRDHVESDGAFRTKGAWGEAVDYPSSTFANYSAPGNALDGCFEKTAEGDITATPVAYKVAQLADESAWEDINAQLYEAA